MLKIPRSGSSHAPSFAAMPFAHTDSDMNKLVMRMSHRPNSSSPSSSDSDSDGSLPEFAWALSFSATFISRLAYAGFLPMSTQVFADLICLLPKLHNKRCALPSVLRDLKVSKGLRSVKGRFTFSIDTAFDSVVAGIVNQHGRHCWFYQPLVDAYRTLNLTPSNGVKVHSSELWDKHSNRLVAGEIGYTIGTVYTSLSGFRDKGTSSCGTLQLACTGRALQGCGYEVWDLGMGFDYKRDLGARDLGREEVSRAALRFA